MQKIDQAIEQMNSAKFQNVGQTVLQINLTMLILLQEHKGFFLGKFLYYKDSEALK